MPSKIKIELDGLKVDHLGFMDMSMNGFSFLDSKASVQRFFTDKKLFVKALKDAGWPADIEKALKFNDDSVASWNAMNDKQKEKFQTDQTKEILLKKKAIIALLKRENVDPSDFKAIEKLHKAGKIGSMLGYDDYNFKGAYWYFYTGTYPNLGWFGFNDKMSSLNNRGTYVFIYQHTWFRGVYLVIRPNTSYSDLSKYGFDNRTSSINVAPI